MTKLQLVLPPKGNSYSAAQLIRIINRIARTFEVLHWDYPIADDSSLVVFFASHVGDGQLDLSMIRRAISWGRTIVVVTGDEGTVTPEDIGPVEIGRIFFFHVDMQYGSGKFISLDRLKTILREALLDIPLAVASPLT